MSHRLSQILDWIILDHFTWDKKQVSQGVGVLSLICIVTLAIHLELVEGMTPAARGQPDWIISENAFHLKVIKGNTEAARQDVIEDPTVYRYVNSQRINWLFIIKLSPWIRGFYERLVVVMKMTLKKSIGKLRLTVIQLQLILVETEATLNSITLIYLKDYINQQVTPTLAHFLRSRVKITANWKWRRR